MKEGAHMAMPAGYEKFAPGVRTRKPMNVRIEDIGKKPAADPFIMPSIAPGVVPKHNGGAMAMDSACTPIGTKELYAWAAQSQFEEGIGFLGFPYLAQLAQRAEYRRPVEIIAEHATRKFIKLKGGKNASRIEELEKHIAKFNIRGVFREAAEHDGFFGRSHIFMDFGDADDDDEIRTPLTMNSRKIGKGSLKNIKTVEPMWCYPGLYEATNPLSSEFYSPREWYVMGREVHRSRLLTLISREVPDVLKAAYAFGGLALTQMGKPYVDNWLRTRQSVSDLLHSFSTNVIKTDLSQMLSGGGSSSALARAQMHNQFRDSRGLMMLDKDSEDFVNVSTPLSGLDKLQAQAQEQMSSVFGIPLVILLGITPSGLNASSDGETRAFYAMIHAAQERVFRAPLQHILKVLMLDLWGEIDEEIDFDFPDLWDMDDAEAVGISKTKAEIDATYIDAGVISPDEARERLSEDDDGLYGSVDLSSPPPEPPEADFETGRGEDPEPVTNDD